MTNHKKNKQDLATHIIETTLSSKLLLVTLMICATCIVVLFIAITLVPNQQWVYTVKIREINIDSEWEDQALEEYNCTANNGWELISVTTIPTRNYDTYQLIEYYRKKASVQ